MASGLRRRIRLGAALAMALPASAPAVGADRTVPALPCTAGQETATIRSVADDLGLVLEDGRTLRLAGIDPVHDTALRPTQAADARSRLQGWLAGRSVGLRLLAAQPDRWGRLPAMVFAPPAGPRGGAAMPVALALVDAGLARGRPEPAAVACWPALLAAETGARRAGLGLWSDPYYAVKRADETQALSDASDGMVIAEGQVAHVGETRTRVYLDLGPRGGLSLRLDRRNLPMLDRLGPSQSGWTGRFVRVRGYVDSRNGPQMDLVDGGQLEVLTGPAVAGGAP